MEKRIRLRNTAQGYFNECIVSTAQEHTQATESIKKMYASLFVLTWKTLTVGRKPNG